MQYALEKKIIKTEQLCFLQGNRTSDACIIINTLIQFYCHKNSKRIFSCFVDVQKAFDTIPRDLLFSKLLDHGVTGKFLNILKTLYLNDKCCVKVGNKITDVFEVNQGVKQGCILSPLLFNIFLSDIVPLSSKTECSPLQLGNTETIGCILWADDLVVLSETGDGMQNMLDNLSSYTEKNGMKINFDKTKSMIFNQSGRHLRRSFRVGKEIIHTTNNYKYLGFILTPSGEINTGLQDLKDRALRAYYSLKGKMGHYFMSYPSTTLHLFDTLIKPILLYNSDYSGCLKLPRNTPIENMHMRFCKEILGVQRQTTNVGELLELGRIPITTYGMKSCMKNYSRIHILEKANKLVLSAHLLSLNCALKWTEGVKSQLNRSGVGSEILFFTTPFSKELVTYFHQDAFTTINSEESKLRTFGKLKTTIGISPYLTQVKYLDSRKALSKVRLSNHDLMIEKGRHLKIDKTQRFCPFCPRSTETELHFLLHCKTYSHARTLVFRSTGHNRNF